MAKEVVSIEVEKATYELALGAGQFVVDLVKALGDGFQVLPDTVAIGAAVIADLLPVASDFAKLAPELKEDKAAFLEAFAVAAGETFKKLVAK